MTLSSQDIIDDIAEVLSGADGEYVVQIHNQICSGRVRYIGDSMYQRVEPEDEPAGMKYYIGKLKEINGEQEYTHTVYFMTDGDPDKHLDDVASRFYDAEGSEEDGSYWHLQGTVLVSAEVCREVPKEFYVQCHEFGAVEATGSSSTRRPNHGWNY